MIELYGCNVNEKEFSCVSGDIILTTGHSETIYIFANFVCVRLLLFRAHELSVSKQMHPIENEKCPYKNSKIEKNESASDWRRRREWNCIRVRGIPKRQEKDKPSIAERVDDGWS